MVRRQVGSQSPDVFNNAVEARYQAGIRPDGGCHEAQNIFVAPRQERALELCRAILEIAPGKYHVEGITTLRYLCLRLGIDHEPASDGLFTVSGLLQNRLERIPEVGDECDWKDYVVKVIEVSKRGQVRVMLSRTGPEPNRGPQTDG